MSVWKPAEPARERPAGSQANDDLSAANRNWRRKIVSRGDGLKPLVDPGHDHLRGGDEAAVTLIEFGDYESRTCMTVATEVASVCRRFDLRFGFRHFPIGDAHPQALKAAQAAEAAGAQGRFWEMHDLLYRRTQDLDPQLLHRLAQKLELDVERFDSEVADETHLRHVMEDFQSGVDSGVSGTPSFFINGARLEWDLEAETLENEVERASRLESR